ncbi:restriction endonuclease [Candidatus Poribacteria bacterium]|nr:restriction endonuclease [Candidatus Poribacteria bacterium]
MLNKTLSTDITRNGSESEFIRLSPGVYGLRTLQTVEPESKGKVLEHPPNHGSEGDNDGPDYPQQVRILFFPVYEEVRHLLKIWPGCVRAQVTGLHRELTRLRGTPQSPVNWTDPDTWIREKLFGKKRDLAMAIWTMSNQDVNPRHTQGSWRLVQKYDLLRVDSDDKLRLTDRGRDFIKHRGGSTEILLDQQEGLAELLMMISDSEPVRFAGLVDAWAEYLEQHSGFKTYHTIRTTLSRRLKNLFDRELIDRKGAKYSTTDAGIAYLKRVVMLPEPDERQQIRKLAMARKKKVRKDLLDHLLQMDPGDFEKLVGHLLEKMNYQNVDVVGRSGDGGVDVIAEIELGVSSVCEVVQAKRHKNPVQRDVLDKLRGSLYRFKAVRGTIVTTSSFAKGAREEAFATGAAPITLIDGDKLVDLLIEHRIGIRKRSVEVLSIDLDGLSQIEKTVEE